MSHLARLREASMTLSYVDPNFDVKDVTAKRLHDPVALKLCELCRNIRFQNLDGGAYLYPLPYLKASCKAGCPLCFVMLDSISHDRITPSDVPVVLWGSRRPLSPVERRYSPSERGPREVERLMISRGHRSLTDPALALVAEAHDPSAKYVHRRPEFEDLGSDKAYHWVKNLLGECLQNHPHCQPQSDNKWPSRLVDIGPPDGSKEPMVIKSEADLSYEYVTLSYSWGGQQDTAVLTQSRINSGQLQFPLESLPRNLQDAVQATRKLGFRYLWIDALCIVQDDGGADFQSEAGNMSNVYGNSVVTIAASAAAGVHAGIFAKDIRHDRTGEGILMPYDMPDGNVGTVSLRYEPAMHGREQANEFLNTRGWALQERLLSNRVIIYRADQISWDCITTTINSKGPLEFFDGRYADSPGRSPNEYLKKDYWSRVVEDFSRRDLTRSADKLKALSGLARHLEFNNRSRIRNFNGLRQKKARRAQPATKNKDGHSDPVDENKTRKSLAEKMQYHAGMWINDLELQATENTYDGSSSFDLDHILGGGRYGFICQLLWQVAAKGVRARPYRAPTFSWASIDGPVDMRSHVVYETTATVVKVNTQLVVGSDPYGEVAGGSLVISGHLRFFRLPSQASLDNLKDNELLGVRNEDLYDSHSNDGRVARNPLGENTSYLNVPYSEDTVSLGENTGDLTDGTPGGFWTETTDLLGKDRILQRHELLMNLKKALSYDVTDCTEKPAHDELYCLQITDKFHLVLVLDRGPKPEQKQQLQHLGWAMTSYEELSWEKFRDLSEQRLPVESRERLKSDRRFAREWKAKTRKLHYILTEARSYGATGATQTEAYTYSRYRRIGILNYGSMPFERGSLHDTIEIF